MAGPSAWTAVCARFFSGWIGLGRFWALVAGGVLFLALVAQLLGPPAPAVRVALAPHIRPPPAARTAPVVVRPAHVGTAIPDPDPALLIHTGPDPDAQLPQIGADGRTPMATYAAPYDRSNHLPRVALIVAGIGASESESMAAIRQLPGAVTLAVSPYARSFGPVLSAARQTRHEYLLSVPMDPGGYPLNDPDDRHALMTNVAPAENLERLHWAMTRFAGYVGVTSVLGEMQGNALMADPEELGPVLQDVAGRGLLFIGGTGQAEPLRGVWGRAADLVVDQDPVDASILDQRLNTLAGMARDKGSALGIVTRPRPVTLDRLAAFAAGLAGKGLVLVPASALVVAPAKPAPPPSQEAAQ